MLTFSDPVAQLKMSKSHSTRISSLQQITLKKRQDKKHTIFSEWLEDKFKQEKELREKIKLETERKETIKARQKRDREMNSRMSYLRWLHNLKTNKSDLSGEELNEAHSGERELNDKNGIMDFKDEIST